MWFTDQQATTIAAFDGLTPAQIAQAAQDAGTLYQYVNANQGIDDAALRAWAETQGIGPDRYNVATAALVSVGKAVQIAANPVLLPSAQSSSAAKTRAPRRRKDSK
jgi:hypothetical protein